MKYEILPVYTQGLEPRGKKDMDDLFANVQASYSLSKEKKNTSYLLHRLIQWSLQKMGIVDNILRSLQIYVVQ